MKRSNIVRGLLIIAVLVLASMTTGCLRASVSVEYESDYIVVQSGVPLEGEFTFTLTGYLGVGKYTSMLVEWLDTDGYVITLEPGEEDQFDIDVTLLPVGNYKVGVLDLATVGDGVIPSVNCFDDGSYIVTDVRFTFTPMGVGLAPVSITVPVD
ncbi:MAG: hypothetical protein BWY85_01272 [Firmicutes bacterium ADurb.Bin506]|nr:MAG: hypothetical protein BWY85_01272 [Firmicutes bacterium ADurb.Bin506]